MRLVAKRLRACCRRYSTQLRTATFDFQDSEDDSDEAVDLDDDLAQFSSVGTQTTLRDGATQTSQDDFDLVPPEQQTLYEVCAASTATVLHKEQATPSANP